MNTTSTFKQFIKNPFKHDIKSSVNSCQNDKYKINSDNLFKLSKNNTNVDISFINNLIKIFNEDIQPSLNEILQNTNETGQKNKDINFSNLKLEELNEQNTFFGKTKAIGILTLKILQNKNIFEKIQLEIKNNLHKKELFSKIISSILSNIQSCVNNTEFNSIKNIICNKIKDYYGKCNM